MADRPHLLVINVDQQRHDCLGFAGHPLVRTPNLDRLAAGGMVFTQACTPSPLCCPARQSFLCSLTPERHGGLWNYGRASGHPWPGYEIGRDCWPRRLAAAGYRNAYLGKWHVHPQHGPQAVGYHTVVDEDAHPQWRGGRIDWSSLAGISGLDGRDPGPVAESYTHRMADEAAAELRRLADGDGPWHLRLDLPQPHPPCLPAAPFADLYPASALPPWPSCAEEAAGKPRMQEQQRRSWGVEGWTWSEWSRIVAQYYAVISQYDDALGRLFAVLDERGLWRDTVVVYTADHGDMTGAHRLIDKHYVMYEEVVRVPLVVRWDGGIATGRCDALVNHYLDLGPTILDLLGLPAAEGWMGQSLAPLLGRAGTWRPRQAVISSYHGQNAGLYTQRMYRERGWKLVWNLGDRDELYDLAADPHECRNLVGDPAAAGELARCRRAMHDLLQEQDDPLICSPWARRQLLEPGVRLD